jgi:hypothetical protein
LLTCVHRRRRETLFAAVAACVSRPRLTLTDIGRRFESTTSLRHGIKRADRLLGNGKLQRARRMFYAALCRVLLARVAEPLILIDWSDLKADQSVHLLRASLAVGGRSLTLYEEVHGQKLLANRGVQTRFLRTLQGAPCDAFGWFLGQVNRGEAFQTPDVDAMPDEAAAERARASI